MKSCSIMICHFCFNNLLFLWSPIETRKIFRRESQPKSLFYVWSTKEMHLETVVYKIFNIVMKSDMEQWVLSWVKQCDLEEAHALDNEVYSSRERSLFLKQDWKKRKKKEKTSLLLLFLFICYFRFAFVHFTMSFLLLVSKSSSSASFQPRQLFVVVVGMQVLFFCYFFLAVLLQSFFCRKIYT